MIAAARAEDLARLERDAVLTIRGRAFQDAINDGFDAEDARRSAALAVERWPKSLHYLDWRRTVAPWLYILPLRSR